MAEDELLAAAADVVRRALANSVAQISGESAPPPKASEAVPFASQPLPADVGPPQQLASPQQAVPGMQQQPPSWEQVKVLLPGDDGDQSDFCTCAPYIHLF